MIVGLMDGLFEILIMNLLLIFIGRVNLMLNMVGVWIFWVVEKCIVLLDFGC